MCHRHTPTGIPSPNHYPFSLNATARTVTGFSVKGVWVWLRSSFTSWLRLLG